MQYQEFIQENTKVIPFNLNQNISESNSKISYGGDLIAIVENVNLSGDTLDGDISRYFI